MTDAASRVRALFAQVLEFPVEEIDDDARFYTDLGGDSLQKLDLAVAVEEEFSVRLTDEQVAAMASVRDVLVELRRASAA